MSTQSWRVGDLVFRRGPEVDNAWRTYLEGLRWKKPEPIIAVCSVEENLAEDAIALATPFGLLTVKEKFISFDTLALIKKAIDEEYPLGTFANGENTED